MDYYQLTIDRKSTREFKEKDVPEEIISELKEYFKVCKRLVPAIKTECKIIDPDNTPMIYGCAGYKDLLIEAPNYLLILSSPEDKYIENAGFVGEDMVLKMTDLGLDSCWITITEPDKLSEKLHIGNNMKPAALIAFGYGKTADTGSRFDIINMSSVTLKQRTGYVAPKLYISDALIAEDLGLADNPSLLDTYTDLYKGLISACCSPSFLNRQPYRFIIKGGKFIFVSLADSETGEADKALNLGIVMLNFYRTLTQRSGVYKGWVLEKPDGDYALPEGSEIVAYFNI